MSERTPSCRRPPHPTPPPSALPAVAAVSNLRARNYRIEEKDKHTSKGIAGKIIPAIATTTGMVAGMVCLELYKLLARRPLVFYRNGFANLAVPFFTLSEPVPVKRSKLLLPPGSPFMPTLAGGEDALATRPDGSREWAWSVWDFIDLQGPLTVKDLHDVLEVRFGVKLAMLTLGTAQLYADFGMRPAAKRERMAMTIPAAVEKVKKMTLPAGLRVLSLSVSGVSVLDGADVDLPVFRYHVSLEEVRAPTGDDRVEGGGGGTGSALPASAP